MRPHRSIQVEDPRKQRSQGQDNAERGYSSTLTLGPRGGCLAELSGTTHFDRELIYTTTQTGLTCPPS